MTNAHRECMYRYFVRTCRFVDAYDKGLDARIAAWAAKQYPGHRTVPETILRDFYQAHKD